MVLIKTPSASKKRDGGQQASVQIFNLAGSKLAQDVTKFLNIDTPWSDTAEHARLNEEEQQSTGLHFSTSGIYGLTTATRLTSSLSHLKGILQIYRDYDYCSRSKRASSKHL